MTRLRWLSFCGQVRRALTWHQGVNWGIEQAQHGSLTDLHSHVCVHNPGMVNCLKVVAIGWCGYCPFVAHREAETKTSLASSGICTSPSHALK